jgi:cyclin B
LAFVQDVTNRAKSNDSKTGKPKRQAGGISKPRPVAKKRDAFSADLQALENTATELSAELAAKAESKRITRLALSKLKDGSNNIPDAKAGSKRPDPPSNKDLASNDDITLPTSNKHSAPALTQSQSPKYLELDLDAPAPALKEGDIDVNDLTYQYSAPFHDIDARDVDDELCVTEYVKEMFEYFRDQEERACVSSTYILRQPEITARMRAILIDWLVLVCTKSKLSPDAFYLCVNIMDRYLSEKKATKRNLQLIGTAALFIASKYEDIYHVPVDDLVYLCDRAYSVEQVYHMEEKILKVLNYQISIPTTYKFLLRFLNAGHADHKIIYLSCYIMELTMLNVDFVEYLPSQLAAAAVYLARRAVGRNGWSPTLLKYAEYMEEEIIPIAREMLEAKSKLSSDLTASKKKYSTERKLKVATIRLPTDL